MRPRARRASHAYFLANYHNPPTYIVTKVFMAIQQYQFALTETWSLVRPGIYFCQRPRHFEQQFVKRSVCVLFLNGEKVV